MVTEDPTQQTRWFAADAIKNSDDKTPKDVIELSLTRLMQFGTMPLPVVQQVLAALTQVDPRKEDRYHTRIIHYLIQLAYGDGYAGTPLPALAKKSVFPLTGSELIACSY